MPAIDVPHPDLVADQQLEQQQLRRLGVGERALRLDSSAKLLMEPFDRVGDPQRLPLAPGEPVEGEQLVPGFLQAPGNLRCPLRPVGDERGVCLSGGWQQLSGFPLVRRSPFRLLLHPRPYRRPHTKAGRASNRPLLISSR